MKEIKIGETVLYKGKVLMAREVMVTQKCQRCVLNTYLSACNRYACTSKGRRDGRSVYFEEVNNG